MGVPHIHKNSDNCTTTRNILHNLFATIPGEHPAVQLLPTVSISNMQNPPSSLTTEKSAISRTEVPAAPATFFFWLISLSDRR